MNRTRSTNARTGRPLLHCAVHEAAHAVVHLVLVEASGWSEPFVSIDVKPDGCELGHCRVGYRLPELPPKDQLAAETLALCEQFARQDIVIALAGSCAEKLQRGASFELFRNTHDMARIHDVLQWLEPPDLDAEMEELFRVTMAIVRAEWPGIVRMAHALRDAVEMDGEEFETRWRAVRPSEKQRQRRLQRMRFTG